VTNPARAELIEHLVQRYVAEHGPVLPRPSLAKPSPGADIASILDYLIKRGKNLDGHAWSDEALRALRNRSNWKTQTGQPPKFLYPAGFDTSHPFLIFFSSSVGDWGLTSSTKMDVQ
jgi:hypothetical protein